MVPPSIGTSGAVAALVDGAIDVGLASRPLKAAERAAGVRAVPWASCPFGPASVAAAARPLDAKGLARLLAGEGDATLFLRELGDSGQALLRSWSPEVAAELEGALYADRWPVVTTDQEMAAAIIENPGAIGFLDSSTAPPGVVLLPGSPLRKELSLLVTTAATPAAKEFVAYATSPAALPVIEAAGCRSAPP